MQDAGQGQPCRDWAGVLLTQMFLNSNLVTPESTAFSAYYRIEAVSAVGTQKGKKITFFL